MPKVEYRNYNSKERGSNVKTQVRKVILKTKEDKEQDRREQRMKLDIIKIKQKLVNEQLDRIFEGFDFESNYDNTLTFGENYTQIRNILLKGGRREYG